MSKLTRDEVLKLAALSRLILSDDEINRMRIELDEILEYVQLLNQVDTGDLTPTYQVNGLNNAYREDIKADYGYSPADLLKNVPALKDGHIKVKRVL